MKLKKSKTIGFKISIKQTVSGCFATFVISGIPIAWKNHKKETENLKHFLSLNQHTVKLYHFSQHSPSLESFFLVFFLQFVLLPFKIMLGKCFNFHCLSSSILFDFFQPVDVSVCLNFSPLFWWLQGMA